MTQASIASSVVNPSNPVVAPFTANGLAISEAAFQNLALNPAQNVVIEACAGSGKTWLLVARLLKLLLNGVPPAQIVAITFTRKAAQEMKQRLADMLDSLQQFDPQAEASSAQSSSAAALFTALGLHEQLDANERIQAAYEQCRAQGDWPSIVTFHEWFGELRQNAPISALANAGAVLTDDEAGLTQQAWQQFWQDTVAQRELQTAMHSGVVALGLNGFEAAVSAMLERRAEWLIYSDALLAEKARAGDTNAHSNNPAKRSEAVQQAFVALAQPQDIASLWTGFQGLLPQAKAIAAMYGKSSTKTALTRAQGLSEATQSQQGQSSPQLAKNVAKAVHRVLQPLSMSTGLVVNTKHYKDMLPVLDAQFIGGKQGFEDAIDELHAALNSIVNQATVLDLIPVHAALLRCGGHLIAAYQSIKQAQGVMDFSDLELDALTLLQQNPQLNPQLNLQLNTQQASQASNTAIIPTTARHLLLDEFQDTNPVQWQALQAYILPVLDEVKAGGQAASVFVVGDPKQSIYRFRRADPKLFSYVQRALQDRYNAVLLKTQRTRRNASSINDWVNAVFVKNDAQLPVNALFSPQFTLSTHAGQVGALPLIDPTELSENTSSLGCEGHTQQTEAEQVVQALLAWKQRHPHKHWSDAMVLSRKRQVLMPIAAQLSGLGIATVSADKGGFFALPEIADALALLATLNNPQDALALLTALRSPLFAINDAQLFELLTAANASESGSAAWLGIAQLDAPWARGITAWLHTWQRLCSHLPIHDALDAMMHHGQWVERFAAAYPERAATVAANLAQLLQLSLAVDQGRYPSLPRFVQAVAQWRTSDQIASLSAAKADAVLLSTIHGAKGLEADCVIMVDLYSRDKVESTVKILLDWQPAHAAPSVFALQLCAASVLDVVPDLAAVLQTQQAAQVTERDTLLYVAMTRAVSELWISATPKKNANSMYERLRVALPTFTTDDVALPPAVPATLQTKSQVSLFERATAAQLTPLHALIPFSTNFLRPIPNAELLSQQHRLALGTLMHTFLEYYLHHQQWTGMQGNILLNTLALRHGVPVDAAQRMLAQCQKMVEKTALYKLFESKINHLAIEENLYTQGITVRPDVVAYQAASQTAWVIDYKMGFDSVDELAAVYAAQLEGYVAAIRGVGFTQVNAVIITLTGQCWTSQGGQWVLSPLPWD